MLNKVCLFVCIKLPTPNLISEDYEYGDVYTRGAKIKLFALEHTVDGRNPASVDKC